MHARMSPLRPSWRALQLLTLASILLCIIVVYTATWGRNTLPAYLPIAIPKFTLPTPKIPGFEGLTGSGAEGNGNHVEDGGAAHPIDQLIARAEQRFKTVLKTQAASLKEAAAQYRRKRGRHPPPGFDAWYSFASEKGAVFVEAFWDQIYHDLGPFWGVEPRTLRQQAHAFSTKIAVRDSVIESQTRRAHVRLEHWTNMLRALAAHPQVRLPDLDVPISFQDEPAVIVPWEEVDTSLEFARPVLASAGDVISDFSTLEDAENENFSFDPEWLGPRLTHPTSALGPRPFWELVRPGCQSGSPTRDAQVFNDIWHPEGHTSNEHSAASMLPLDMPLNTSHGYAANWTLATDVCLFPNLQGLHGTFVAPEQMSVSQKLFPLFGASKLSISNEILLPSAADWNASDSSPEDTLPAWSERDPELFWRGPAIGGKNTANNWQRFHRHRFVSMANASQVEIAEASLHSGNESTVGVGYAGNFRLLPTNDYHLKTQTNGRLAEWVNGWADVEFTDLHCNEHAEHGSCLYTDKYFSISRNVPPGADKRYKYGVALDGNGGGDSSEFIQSLKDGKVMLRASVYRNWFDSRLHPWLHFVPVDNAFVDLYAIMEYFLGTAVSDGAREYPHLEGEVQHHEHHFKASDWAWQEEADGRSEGKGGHGRENVRVMHAGSGTDGKEAGMHYGNEPHGFSSHEHGAKVKRQEDDGHDVQARKIAKATKAWADTVLRKDDMLIYVYRLLLEYARVVDDRRNRLGWVDDLTGEGS